MFTVSLLTGINGSPDSGSVEALCELVPSPIALHVRRYKLRDGMTIRGIT